MTTESSETTRIEAFNTAMSVASVAGRVVPRGPGERSLTPAESDRLERFAPAFVASLRIRMGSEAGSEAAFVLAEAIWDVPGRDRVVAHLVGHVDAARLIAARAVELAARTLEHAERFDPDRLADDPAALAEIAAIAEVANPGGSYRASDVQAIVAALAAWSRT